MRWKLATPNIGILTLICICSAASVVTGQTASEYVQVFSGPGSLDSPALSGDDTLYRVTGSVIDDRSEMPIPGATVTITIHPSNCARASDKPAPNYTGPNEVRTDKDGVFVFQNVPGWHVTLNPSKQGYLWPIWPFRQTADDPVETYIIGPGTGPITLRMAQAAVISGIVRDQNGAPMADVYVTLRHLRPWAGWRGLETLQWKQTGIDGSYFFDDLRPDRYYVVADPPINNQKPPARNAGDVVGYAALRYPGPTGKDADPFMRLTEGGHVQADFRFHQEILHHVSGTVSGNGKNSPMLDAIDPNGSKSYWLRSADFGNRFEAWLPRGNYELRSEFTSPTGQWLGSAPLEVAESDISGVEFRIHHEDRVTIPVEITNPFRRNAPSTICQEDPGCGFSYLQLIEMEPHGYFQAADGSTQTGTPASEATSRLESVSALPGRYTVAVVTSGNFYAKTISSGTTDLMREPLLVSAGEVPEPVRIVLAEGAIVEGIARRNGIPVSAWVYALPEQPDMRLLPPIQVKSDGQFRFEGLAPGKYLFFATDALVNLDVHDPEVVRYWRQRALELNVQANSKTQLDLQLLELPVADFPP